MERGLLIQKIPNLKPIQVKQVTHRITNIDSTIRRISTTYEARGMVKTLTSYASPTVGLGLTKNQVEYEYNDFGQLKIEKQEHDGAVDASTPKVQYGYYDGSNDNGATNNTIRPVIVAYPHSRGVVFDYGTTGGDDDKLSRIEKLKYDATDVASYTYLGLGTIVDESYDITPFGMSLGYTSSNNTYNGFDRFGRVVDQKWDIGTIGAIFDHYKYGYDRASNRTYREIPVNGGDDFSELYTYDNLRRLTGMNRGELVDAKDRITDPKLTQNWQLDPTGNWNGFSNFDQSTSANTLVQQRTANPANEITDVTETVGDPWKTPLHDRNGNMTAMPNAKTPTDGCLATYDAWNRLVKIETDDITPVPIAEYQYDGMNRRTRKYVPGTPNSYQHFYYNAAWQILETREDTNAAVPTDAQYQYVWSLRYIDAPILRETFGGSTNTRHYYSTDANFNVTALYEDGDPTPVERYTYDPYGNVTIYDGNWTTTRTESAYNNSTLYTGQWHDPETGLMNYRNRYYHPTLGRFVSRDPIGYDGGINLYEYVDGSPTVFVDPLGLAPPTRRRHSTIQCHRPPCRDDFSLGLAGDALLQPPKPLSPDELDALLRSFRKVAFIDVSLPKSAKGCEGNCFSVSNTTVVNVDITHFSLQNGGLLGDCGVMLNFATIGQLEDELKAQIAPGRTFSSETCPTGCSCQRREHYNGKSIAITLDKAILKPDPARFPRGLKPGPKCRIVLSGTIKLKIGMGWVGACCPKP